MNEFSSMKNNLRIMFTFSDLIIIYTYVLKENIPFRKKVITLTSKKKVKNLNNFRCVGMGTGIWPKVKKNMLATKL